MLILSFGQLNAQSQEYGYVEFEVSCEEEVRDDFNRALAMLHHMMYQAARSDFREITQADPRCAMGYWGVATTLFQPLWGTRPGEEELEEGWQAINKARELAENERERLLVESTAAFFREPETAAFWTRIRRWADAVQVAYEAYPGDANIAALYGLTRLAIAQRADMRGPFHDEAEAVLRKIYEEHPTHPGAIHYTIHATDVDGRAENALDMVEAYGRIAPAIPHALHMPTHIHVRLGNWPAVVDWNLESAEAALNHPAGGSISHHYLHAVDYLVYAYLQRGQYGKAEEVYQSVLNKAGLYQASFVSAYHFAAMPARLAVEGRDWERAASIEPGVPDYLPWNASPWPEGLSWYAKGLGAVHTGDVEGAQKVERRLAELSERARSGGAEDMASYIEIDRQVLAGWIAHARGEDEKALERMASAAALEENTEKHPVAPGSLQPPYEAMGDLLLRLDRPEEALSAYEASDDIWPGRLNTLMGAALAARMAGEDQLARRYFMRLLKSAGSPAGETDRTEGKQSP